MHWHIKMEMNRTHCDYAALMSQDLPIRIAIIQQLIGCFCGTAPLFYYFVRGDKMPAFLNGVGKVLLYWMMAFLCIHNVCLFCVNAWHQYNYLTFKKPCDLMIITWKCLLFRIPTITCIVSMTGIYLLITINRIYEFYWPRRYAELDLRYIQLKIFAFMFFFTSPIIYYVFRSEDIYFYKVYCVASSAKVNSRLMVVYQALFPIDLTCTLVLIVLLRRSLLNLRSNKHGFVVQRKVEMRVNIASIRFIMALTVFRFIFFGTFEFASFVVRRLLPFDNFILMRGIIDQFYIIHWSGCAFAVLLHFWRSFVLPYSDQKFDLKEERKLHFQQLNNQWNLHSSCNKGFRQEASKMTAT